jgi:hypothetical protein
MRTPDRPHDREICIAVQERCVAAVGDPASLTHGLESVQPIFLGLTLTEQDPVMLIQPIRIVVKMHQDLGSGMSRVNPLSFIVSYSFPMRMV